MISNKEEKILVIGQKISSKQIESYEWYSVPDKLNLADYHYVLFDISKIQGNDIIHSEFGKIFEKNYWNLFFSANSRIYIFGTPESIRISDSDYGSRRSPLDFLIGRPSWDKNEGDIITNVAGITETYINKLNRWYFHFNEAYDKPDSYEIDEISRNIGFHIKDINMKIEPLAENNYGKAISALFLIDLISANNENKISAPVYWLPVNYDDNEYLQVFLRIYFSIDEKENKPKWISKFSLNSIDEMKKELKMLDNETERIDLQKNKITSNISEREKILKLLYEQGEPLENVVKIALNELNCKVIALKENCKEDVRFIDPIGNEWICEVKGRKGNLKRDDIRQIDDWIKQAKLESDWKGYACIIGNYNMQEDPNKRKDPISDNEKKALKRFGIAYIPTNSLYDQILKKEEGKYKKEDFWRQLCEEAKYHD